MRMSACGVLCSDCPAYRGAAKGGEYQEQVAEAWTRIYQRPEAPEKIACGGCLSSDAEVFYTSVGCTCRLCCLSRTSQRGLEKGFGSCAECPEADCEKLEQAQAVWDGVPDLLDRISDSDFETYARPYCDHRRRIAAARAVFQQKP